MKISNILSEGERVTYLYKTAILYTFEIVPPVDWDEEEDYLMNGTFGLMPSEGQWHKDGWTSDEITKYSYRELVNFNLKQPGIKPGPESVSWSAWFSKGKYVDDDTIGEEGGWRGSIDVEILSMRPIGSKSMVFKQVMNHYEKVDDEFAEWLERAINDSMGY